MGFKDLVRNFISVDSKKNKEFSVDFSDNQYIKIYVKEDGQLIDIDSEDDNIFTLLSMTNLELAADKKYLKISYQQVYDLYFENDKLIDDYKSLALPDLYQGYIKIENIGNFIQDKEVKYSFYFADAGANYDIETYKNNIIISGQEYKILPPDIYELITSIKRYNNEESNYSDVMKQFKAFSEIKDYAQEGNVLLNSRLSNEQKPIIVDEITIDFAKKEDGLEIYPQIEGKGSNFNQDLVDKFDRDEQIRNFYNVDDNGKKRKVIFENKESAKKVKRNRFLDSEKELQFYAGKNELWEDDNLDLSKFGPRVKGFGYLNYRSNAPTSGETDRSWFDSDVSTDFPKIYTQTGESFRLSYQDRERFADSIRTIKEEGKEVIGLEFSNQDGNTATIPMNEEQLSNEIEKVNNATINIDKIRNKNKVKAIRDKLKRAANEEFIPFEGRFIKTFSLSYVKQHLKKLTENQEDKKEKKESETEDEAKEKTVLIKENLEEEEFIVRPESKIEASKLEIPKSLDANLYPHQKIGIKKLQTLYRNDTVNGLLLADDMGLGKTLQLLTFLAWLKEKNNLNSTLVVAPTTLINDWDNESQNNPGEIQKFFPNDLFKTYKIRGRISENEVDEIADADIAFTSYTSLRMNNIKLSQLHWDLMICDEAQKVKNATTQVSVAVKAQNADFKVACSATPIENNLLDLWNIMDYTIPGILGARNNFKKKYVNRSNKASDMRERKKLNEELAEKIDENFLRRNKKEELDNFPNKIIELYGITANPIEIEKIKELNQLRQAGVNHLPLIQKLVALCSHVALIDNNLIKNDIKDLVEMSSKLKKTKEIIDAIKEKGEKVIIFTIFRKMQKILIKAINYWFGFVPGVLNGTIAQDKRQKILDKFRKSKGFNVIVLSPEVAGVGIDLVEANHVIHYTRLWNPAKEDQATDRTYRIGQKKDVSVYYPILTLKQSYRHQFNSELEYIDKYLKEDIKGKSPEEKLNKLLVKKKNLLLNFFFAAGDSKIDWSEAEEDQQTGDYININNVFNLLDPYEFEILVAKIYQREGYQVYPTVKSGDRGADIVASKDNHLTLIQAKQIRSKRISATAINEVFSSKNVYNNQLAQEVKKIVVVTTAQKISYQNKDLAKQNNVGIILKRELAEKLAEHKIYYSEINADSEERYSIEQLKHTF